VREESLVRRRAGWTGLDAYDILRVMMASLAISLSGEVLRALKATKSITLSVGPGAPAPRAAPAKAQRKGTRRAKAADGPGGFREGSLPAKLLAWAGGRKRPFGVPDVMKALKVKRPHASMVLTRVLGLGGVRRVERGEYLAK
jgi:hypothetical protein